MLTEEQVRKILCAATTDKIMILTVNDNTAVNIKSDIVDYITSHGLGSTMSEAKQRGYIFFSGGFENICIMSADWWNSHATIDFNGTVYVTNRIITDIRHITNNPLPFTELIERTAV